MRIKVWREIRPTSDGRVLEVERGRRVASEREDLIAAGVDPSELVIPLAPDDPEEPTA
jgi:hypothetical protein